MMPCNIVAGLFAAFCKYLLSLSLHCPTVLLLIVFPSIAVSLCMGSDLTALDGVDFVYIWLQGVGVLAVGFTLLTIAPTYIPAPEVSLYTLIETVLGPVWVYLGGYEAPSVFAVAGGAILLVALAVHRYYYCYSLYFYCNCNF